MATRPGWDSDAAVRALRAATPRRRLTNAAVYDLLFKEARIAPGMRVLDVGAGNGDQSLPIARMVGPAGSVLATDISAPVLAALDEDARSEGILNIETRAVDACCLDLPPGTFDAAVSGNCLQFVADPAMALRCIRAALKPGARFAAIVGSSVERSSPLIAHVGEIIHRLRGLPPPNPEKSAYSSLGAPRYFEGLLRDAGFHEVRVEAVPLHMRYDSTAAIMRTIPDNANFTALLNTLDDAQRAMALEQIEAGLDLYKTVEGAAVPYEMLVGSGTA